MFASEIGGGSYRMHPGPIRKEAFRRDSITGNGHAGSAGALAVG